ERGFRDPPLRPHRGLAREQLGKRGFCFARRGLGGRKLLTEARRMALRIVKPLLDRAPLLLQLLDRLRSVSLERLLPGEIRAERGVQPVELGEATHDRVAPRAGASWCASAWPSSRSSATELRFAVSSSLARSCADCASAMAWWIRPTSSLAALASAAAASALFSASSQRAWRSRASTPRIWSVSFR